MKKVYSILSAIIVFVTFALVITLLVTRISGKTPELFGYQIFRVSSSSMEPELMVGDIILSQNVDDITDVKFGDIITYRGEKGTYKGKSITHQVITEPYLVDGVYYLETMGIANDSPDPIISEEQVIGKMVSDLPLLSCVYSFFMTPWGLIIVLGFLAILFINEIFALRQISCDEKEVPDSRPEEVSENIET